jgi:hypothetical protein
VTKTESLPDGLLLIGNSAGMIDVIVTKGRYLGGVYGAQDAAKAEATARAFQKSLPADAGDPNAELPASLSAPAQEEPSQESESESEGEEEG